MPSFLRMAEMAASLKRKREQEDKRARAHAKAARCQGKKAYTSWAGAQRDARMVKRHRGGPAAHPYHCQFCQFVHLGFTHAT